MFDMALYALTCFIGAMLQSLCGFGSGILAMSVLPHFYHSYTLSLVLSTFLSFAICISIVMKEYKYVNIRMLIPIIIGNILATTSIMYFWDGSANYTMKKILGGFLILLSLYFIFFNRDIKIKPAFKTGLLSGLLGGTGNSFFSMGGPPVVAYLIITSRDNKEYIASLQAYFSFSATYVTISRYMRGMVTEDVWPIFFAGLPFIFIGIWIGRKLFGMLDEKKLKLVVYTLMALSGAVMILTN